MMLSVRVGTNDVEKARAFYDATFVALGGSASTAVAGSRVALYKLPGGMNFIVGPAANGDPATFANGGTILLNAKDEAAVDAWYAAALAHGGGDEGAPGPRERVGGRYGAYLRDPDGNKFGCFAGSPFG